MKTLALLLAASLAASATTIDLNFSEQTPQIQSVGTGAFTYTTGLTSFGVSDLSAFTFSIDTTFGACSLPYAGPNCGDAAIIQTFSLAGLAEFAATADIAGNIDTLSIMGAYGNGGPDVLLVGELTNPSLNDFFLSDWPAYGDVVTSAVGVGGSPTPEPLSIALIGGGLLGLGLLRRNTTAKG